MAEEETTKSGKLAIVLVRGVVGVAQPVKDTLSLLRLHKKNYCVVVDNNPVNIGMIKKVKDYVTWGEIDENTFKELVEKSQDLLAEEALVEEKKIMERFFNSLSTKGGGKAAYKEEDVMKALKLGAVDVLLISEDIEDEKLDDLEQKAEAIGAKVYLISLETMEGQQLKELGGLAAILRYKV